MNPKSVLRHIYGEYEKWVNGNDSRQAYLRFIDEVSNWPCCESCDCEECKKDGGNDAGPSDAN